MSPPTTPLGKRMDAEWRHLATSPTATQALAHWAQLEPAIAGLTDLEQLRNTVHNRADHETSDRILAALIRLANQASHGDLLATRVVLQLLIPGGVRLAHTLAVMLGDQHTSEAMVFAELTIGIRTYPWRRRPTRIAANLLLDTRQRLTRTANRRSPELPIGLLADEQLTTLAKHRSSDQTQQADTRLTVAHLLWWARRRKIINAFEAQLLHDYYLADTPMDQLAHEYGRARSTLFALRAAAVRRLRSALADTWNHT